MKYINEECKPFGLCSEEVREKLLTAKEKGTLEIFSHKGTWVEFGAGHHGIYENLVYRTPIQEKRKLKPCDLAGYWCKFKGSDVFRYISGFGDDRVSLDNQWYNHQIDAFFKAVYTTYPTDDESKFMTYQQLEDNLNG